MKGRSGQPRRRVSRKSRNKPRIGNSGITTASYSTALLLNFGSGTGFVSFGFYPHALNFCTRFDTEAYNYRYYRIVALSYTFHPTTTRVSDEYFAHAVLPQDDGGLQLSSFSDLVQMPGVKIYDARMISTQRNRISRKSLLDQPTRWYSTTNSGNTLSDWLQCKLVAASSIGVVSNQLMTVIKFVVEYRGAASEGTASPLVVKSGIYPHAVESKKTFPVEEEDSKHKKLHDILQLVNEPCPVCARKSVSQ